MSQIERLENSVNCLLSQIPPQKLPAVDRVMSPPAATINHIISPIQPVNHVSPGQIDASPSIVNDDGFVPAPMSNLHSLAKSRLEAAPITTDFIDRGLLTLTEAHYLFEYYMDNINNLLWAGILCSYSEFQQARSSPILLSAILTVAAFHAPGRKESLQIAYNEFVSLIEKASLIQGKSLDDVRGLCIGAFYLTNLSWKLCSQAIRMATEMNLHHVNIAIKRDYDKQAHEHIRLWYVLYICDHQFATAYGRPTLMHDDIAVDNIQRFLASQHATPGDVRLAGQLKIQQILNQAVTHFGLDTSLELGDDDYEQLRAFNLKLDQWRIEWVPKSADMPLYRTYPSRSKVLYYHFGRFHLNALSLRGISAGKIGILDWNRREAANAAITAAINTLRLVIEESDIQRALVGVPIFTHSIIAICASFLIKVVVVFGAQDSSLNQNLSNHGLNLYTADVLKLVQDLIDVFAVMAEKVSHRHLACDIVVGLRDLLKQFESRGNTYVLGQQSEIQDYDFGTDFNWSFDDSFLWQYDEGGIQF